MRELWVILLLFGFLTHFTPDKWNLKINNLFVRMHWSLKALALLLAVQLVIQLAGEEVQPFIYFQF